MSKLRYNNRILLPIAGDEKTIFFTKGRLKIAKGYSKALLLKIPTIEFLKKNIALENLFIPHHLKWRIEEKSSWIEYRSKDYCQVRIKFCKQNQKFYASALELYFKEN